MKTNIIILIMCVCGGGHTYPQMHMNSTIEMESP